MKKSLSMFFAIFLIAFLCFPTTVNADTVAPQEGIAVHIFTDKSEYSYNEDVNVTVKVENASAHEVSDAHLRFLLPDSFVIVNGRTDISGIKIEKHGIYSADITLQLKQSPVQSDGESEKEDTYYQNENSEANTEGDALQNPNTANSPIIVLVIISGICLAVVFTLKGKTAFRLFSLMMCAVVIFSAVPFDTFAQAEPQAMLSANVMFNVNGEVYTVDAEFTYTQNVQQYVSAEIAQLFGVNAYEYDSDNDGLSNYIEIYTTMTDPARSDTDENGVKDSEEDCDKDGISNIDEVSLETDPSKTDSDDDGISDYEEVTLYNTSPVTFDTDGDSLCDGDEAVLGLDPLNVKTNGETFDFERIIHQTLKESNISEQLLINNAAVPSLVLDAKGNINRNTTIDITLPVGFGDSRAIIGKAVKISGNDVSKGVLTFKLSDISLSEHGFQTLSVCRYTSDNTVEYLPTDFNESDNTVSAAISSDGVYFVLNIESMFNELGVSLPSFDSQYSKKVYAQNVLSSENADTTSQANEVMAQADIVFVIDSTASMRDEIDNVKNNVGYFVDALKEKGVSAALALVDYQDITVDGTDSTHIHQTELSNWFYDIEKYKDALSSISLGYGGDEAECAVDALESARLLDMRASSGKIFILVTDASYKTDNRYGIPSMKAEIELLINAGVNCCVISPQKLWSTYYDLYNETNGVWEDVYGDFYEKLMSLANTIGDTVVGQGYWIYLDGPVPVPVRLDAPLEEGSMVDTDKDGIPDVEELEGVVPSGTVDLDALITQISGGVITGTNYGTVQTYKYSSNPTEPDTDFDGTEDLQDTMPASNDNVGIMHYTEGSAKTCNVEFTVDYRDLIDGDNEVYSKNLSVLASLYASDVYDGLYIEITQGAITGGNDTATTFGNMLGLEDSQYIGVKSSQYTVDKDDITDFYVGHRKIVYNGVENEVIIVSIRGTNGTNAEWSSNFDVGADTQSYYNATGTHPHWLDKNNHKGFDVTANRVIEKLQAYLEAYVDQTVQKNILITGHSRGAAIANIVGKHFEDDEAYNSYTYTFATPNSTVASNAAEYKTIFNLVNEDDIIAYLPLNAWGFTNYGTIKSISILNNYTGSKTGSWEDFIGASYNNDSGTQRTLDCFGAIASTRNALYELDTTADGKVWENNLGHITKKGAEEELATLSADLQNEKLLKFCNLYVVGGGLLYHVEVNYSPAYFMQMIANMTTGVGPLLGHDVKGKYATAKASFVASSGVVVIGGMTHPHMQPTYYYIAHTDFKAI